MTITPTPIEPVDDRIERSARVPSDDPAFAIPIVEPMPSAGAVRKPSRRTAARTANRHSFPTEATPAHHALYRLCNADGVLLYVGETNNPVERYVEHRETKEWWPEVFSHSIEWFKDGREKTQEREKDAIRDEWPLYNVAHQPRGNGTYFVPSYVVKRILDAVEQAVCEVIDGATGKQARTISDTVFDAFTPRDDEETGICGYGEIGFPFGDCPRAEPLNLDAVLDSMGPFRPDIDNSMRDPKPRNRSGKHCKVAMGSGPRVMTCGRKLRRDGSCPDSERHPEAAFPLMDPLDAVDDA